MVKLMNVPKLRFPEFTDEWKGNELGAIAKFSKGKGVSKSEIAEGGITECIRYGELYTRYGEVIDEVFSKTNVSVKDLVISEANDVIIPASGETQIDIATASCVIRSGIALGGDLNIIKTSCNGVFLSYYLNNKKKISIANLAQGISVVHLYSSQLSLLELNLPSLTEQTRIATFISVVADKIAQLNMKKSLLENYKKGVMQQLFSKELRFKDEDGNEFSNWKKNKLGKIGTFFSGGTPLTTKREFFDGEIPFIRSGEINSEKTEQFLSELGLKNSSSKMIEVGDLIYALYGATSGEVAISRIKGAINQAILCIRTNEDNRFLYYYLLLNKEIIIKTYLQGGQGNLSADIIKSIEVPLPSLPEQQKIASFLSALDEKIAQTALQIEKMQLWKKGLLQQMFV